jgi:hypothetical protein
MMEKRAVWLLTVLMMIIPCLLAGAEVLIGTKKGVAFSSVYGYDGEGDETRGLVLGFNGGVFVGIPVTRWLSLQPEILFNQRGVTEKDESIGMDFIWVATYFDIPILAKVNLSFLEDLLRAGVYLGPQFSFGVSSTLSSEGSDPEDAEEVEPFDLGIVMGAEAGIHLLQYYVFLDFRYNLGFLPIVDPNSVSGQNIRNSTFSFLLGLGLFL